MINKPLSMIREETIIKLTDTINQSGLSPIIIVPILKDLLYEAQAAQQRLYELDKIQYAKALSQEQKESPESVDNL